MLPTVTMLTNQKCAAVGRCAALALLMALAACMPPGPRALLNGERLIKEGKFDAAIAALTEATLQLPRNAQAWNHLGLANHNAGRANDALRAYRKALDVDVNLAAARFNLGCLLLEINQPAAAAGEFAAYTMAQPKAVDGWLKRGRAEMLARQHDAADKSLRAALTLNPKQPEVWNTLGIVQLYRAQADPRRAVERYADAFLAFNNGVQQQANYAPALFNAALVSHFYLSHPARRGVDQRPFALEKYKAFLALNPTVDNLEAIQQVVAHLETELSPKPPAPKFVIAPPTNPPPAVAVAPKPEPPPLPRPVPPVEPVAAPKKPEPEPVKPVVVAAVVKPEPPAPKPAPVVPKPAPPAPVPVFRPEPVAPAPKPAPPRVGEDIAPGWAGPRYAYLTPDAPTPGSRADAQTHFAEGLAMQRIGKNSDALASYQRAIRADGAFFEAYHNLGIVAAQMGDLLKSTAAYETALALEPDSASARFNFALALQRGGYLRDAATELTKLLAKTPDDAGAHFVLANLYSQNFNQPGKARPHYVRVLELRPQHPQATAIRFWLRENP
ncbi:MAG: periplasmic protein TonB [Limisphaerales bacterium]|nr:MAG: periplasmic protein TonB [Limisphaerales bacterium]KAG0510077.1 MAG: periplasmic protein TonB [Limisphaerales bacterium]